MLFVLSSLYGFSALYHLFRPLSVLLSVATVKYNSSRLRRKPLALGRLADLTEKHTDLGKLTFAKYITTVRLYDHGFLTKT